MNDVTTPIISILIYNYDTQALSGCLDSILEQQEIRNFEVILCDDCTTDGAWDIANAYMERHPGLITLVRNQAPSGPEWSEGRLLLQMVRGKYYVLLTKNRPFDPGYIQQVLEQIDLDPLFLHAYIGRKQDYRPAPLRIKPDPELKTGKNPLVSICIHNYNYGRFLLQCLESIATQTYGNIEICFSDNASTDDSWRIALEFSKRYPKKMSLSRNRENFGPSSSNENTLYDAQGKYLLMLCSDDAIHPAYVERCVTLLERFPEAGFAMVHRDIVDIEGNISPEPPFYDQTCCIPSGEQLAVYMMAAVNPSISQILYRRELVTEKRLPGTLTDRWFGSRILDFKICCDHSMVYIKQPLLLHRVHSNSDGASIDENLIQCFGQYILAHQFADLAAALGHTKAAGRREAAVEKVGRLCLRYCLRFLMQENEVAAFRHFRLAEAILPSIVDDGAFKELAEYWKASREDKARIIAELGSDLNLHSRAVIYPAPPDSIPCQ